MNEDEIILNEFRKVLMQNTTDNVVDLDDRFKYKFDFQVHRYEDVLRDTNRNVAPHRWSYYRIGLVKKGSGDFITGIYNFTATKNTLIIIPTRVINSNKNWTLDVEGYVVLFNLDFFLQNSFPHQLIENKRVISGPVQPFLQLSDKHGAEMASIFETIISESQGNNFAKNELIALKILELLITSERLFDEQLNFKANLPVVDMIREFTNLVETNFLQERTVTYYADKLNVHPNYLNSVVKKHTGRTAKESIQNRLLLEIKYLLHSTNLSVKAISNQMGFTDPNYFSAFFTRLENISPKKYRSSFL